MMTEAMPRSGSRKPDEPAAQPVLPLTQLFAEMAALSALIPGLQQDHRRSDAEIEADFDNMPV